jgi:hypothetical protein
LRLIVQFTKGEPLIYSCTVQAKTMVRLVASASLTLCLVLTSGFAADSAADRVYRNGKVFTADAEGSIAEAVAIRDGRIVCA